MYVCTSCRFSFCDWCFLSRLIDLFSLKLLSGESCLAMLWHVKKKCALRELVTGFWRPVNHTGSSQDVGIREVKRKSVVWSVRVSLLCEVWDQSWQIIIDELESTILWLTRTSQLTVRLFRFMESLVSIRANTRCPFPRNAYVWHGAWEQLVRRGVTLTPATVVNKSEALSLQPCMWFCAPFWVLSSARRIHLPNRREIIQVIIWSWLWEPDYLL